VDSWRYLPVLTVQLLFHVAYIVSSLMRNRYRGAPVEAGCAGKGQSGALVDGTDRERRADWCMQ